MVDGDYIVCGAVAKWPSGGEGVMKIVLYISRTLYICIECVYVCTSYDKVETDPKADPF